MQLGLLAHAHPTQHYLDDATIESGAEAVTIDAPALWQWAAAASRIELHWGTGQ